MLIDHYLPRFQFSEKHALLVQADPDLLLDAATQAETMEDPWTRRFIDLRELPDRILGKLGTASGLKNKAAFGLDNFLLLGRDGEREIALGLLGKFWQADYGLITLDSTAAFARFDQLGVPKLVLNFSTEIMSDGRIRLSTETRVFCNDRHSILRFTPYWWLIRPVSGLIRRRLLKRIAHAAKHLEQSAKEQ